jgi:hypothetical protein
LLKNPYGIRDGVPVLVDDVERGLACNCTCPSCGEPLEAHKGDIVLPYFAHFRGATECGYGYETALHLLAKEVLAETKRLLLPPLRVRPDRSVWFPGSKRHQIYLVPEAGELIHFDSVSVEHALGGMVPDVVLVKYGRKLIVEIKVTHGIDDEKRAKIRALDVSAIEYDFSAASRAITKQDLKGAFLSQYTSCQWFHHPKHRETLERVNREFLEMNPRPAPIPPPVPAPPPRPKSTKPTQLSLWR